MTPEALKRDRQNVATAARMYEMQETAARLFGDSYSDRVAPWIKAIEIVAEKLNCGPIQAALWMANRQAGLGAELTDYDVLLLVSAAVELCEGGEVGERRNA